MLDEFKDVQFVAYKQLKNILCNNASHAYLFNTNNNVLAKKMIMSFVKSIVCKYNYTNFEKCDNCSICNRIDNNNYPEIKVIKPAGSWIKKDQLIELQKSFSTKAIEGEKRIYIIHEIEKLNKQAANSLLKFLEEPNQDIIAILITDKINLVMDTILSRCQTIILKQNSIEEYIDNYKIYDNITLLKLYLIFKNGQALEDYVKDENNIIFIEDVISFIKKYEDINLQMIINTKKYFHDKFVTKEDFTYAIELIILFYRDVLYYKIKNQVNIFNFYIEDIKEIADKNNKDTLLEKIKKIIEIKELIKNNINSNLLIDKLIISLEGGVYNA